MTITKNIIKFFIDTIDYSDTKKYEKLKYLIDINEDCYKTFINEYINEYLYYDLYDFCNYTDYEINKIIDEWKRIYNEVINNMVISMSKRENRNDKTFKEGVRDRANNKCQVCGYYNTLNNFDVAHIYEFAECSNDYEKYNVNNGLLLRSDIHRAWDAGHLIIEYDISSRAIYFKMDNRFKLSETYLSCYETDFNIIPIKFEDEYFEEYCKFIDLRNKKVE